MPDRAPRVGAAGVHPVTPYYDDGTITIYHGDCRELLPLLHADVILTDPPYGIGVRYGNASDDDRLDYWQWLREVIGLMRTAAPVVAFTHKVGSLHELAGWDHIAVWHKPVTFGVRLGNSPVLPQWEPIYLYGIHSLGTKSDFTPDVFTAKVVPVKHGGNRGREGWATQSVEDHPTPKPEGLYRRLLLAFGPASSVVLDPFMGSGTTLRVAKDEGRKAIGIEIEERFCDLAARRLGQECFDFGEAS